jgi:stearoyl-CoA desaturase (delta-9 desaturase)
MDLGHQIYRYRILYTAGWVSLFVTFGYCIYYGMWWTLLAAYLWSRVVTFIANQIALHRYFCHRSFQTTPLKRRFLLWFSILGGEGSPIAWATHHRHHHQYTEKANDIHSPYKPHGSWFNSMFGWQVRSKDWWLFEKKVKTVPKDLMRDNEIRFVDKHYYTIWMLIVIASALLFSWQFAVFYVLMPVGMGLFNAIGVNWVSHKNLPGSYRNFDTEDKTYNNQWVAYYLGGEGLHNNHHKDGGKYDQAFFPGEFDFGGWFVRKFFLIK